MASSTSGSEPVCANCGKPIREDPYLETWVHLDDHLIYPAGDDDKWRSREGWD